MRTLPIVIAVMATACTPQANSPAPSAVASATTANTELEELKSQVLNLRHDMEVVNTRMDLQPSLNRQWQSATIDPTESVFERVDASNGVGSFALLVTDVHQFGDGVRIRLSLGNLTSARISGVTLSLKYGPRRPDGPLLWDAWSKELRSKEQAVLEPLQPGAWNPVNVVLPQIEERKFGYLEVRLSATQIALR
jgi:hypothetical protein